MTRFHFTNFIIIAATVLLIINIYDLDFNNIKNGPFSGIVSNLLIIIAMILTRRDIKKRESKN
ncbi:MULTISPECIES: hypothetical protein [unclassified Olleya]|jgi:hypothetical protein|uniref:hypothetical protein n=1 Tax=unclassified Olleya TaxID=2615019 RepID=UPI0011A7D3F6|nr:MULTISPECIES: hypothetical protein [unclassified Olleya]TVZ46973.1 hypothetical protein JM82_1563 [Olleya sp. Hel_I_94]